jgi:hypothetical protein
MKIFNWFRKEKEEKIPVLPCVHMLVPIEPLVYKGDFFIFTRCYNNAYQELAKNIKYILIKRHKCVRCQNIIHDNKRGWMYSSTPNDFTILGDNVICDTNYKHIYKIDDLKTYEEYDIRNK